MFGEQGHLVCWDAEVAGGGIQSEGPETSEILPDHVTGGHAVGAAMVPKLILTNRTAIGWDGLMGNFHKT